jgi:hypothetical protein
MTDVLKKAKQGLLKTWFMKNLEISMLMCNVCNGFVV